jgi:hypothetical protein
MDVTRAPFGILGGHGVPKDQIALLVHTFGPRFPNDHVDGPHSAICWALAMLPWPSIARVVRPRFDKLAQKSGIRDDKRIVRTSEVLADEPAPSSGMVDKAFADVESVLETLTRLKGMTIKNIINGPYDSEDLTTEFRTWAFGFCALNACAFAIGPVHSAEVEQIVASVDTALIWALMDVPSAWRETPTDQLVQDVMSELARFVGTWSGGASA